MVRFPICLHGINWDKFLSFLTVPLLFFTLLYSMDVNGSQQLSRKLASTNCEKLKMA
jgi:hypothetical protein